VERLMATLTDGVPYREVLDSDAERGVAVYDLALKQVYSNPVARAVLRDAVREDVVAFEAVLASYRARLERSEFPPAPPEVSIRATNGRRFRAAVTVLGREGPRHLVARFAAGGTFAEPTARALQARFGLTQREAEIALAVALGASNGEAASRLGVSEKTVKNSLIAIYAKCGAGNRVELALRACDASPPPPKK
jgi:DNA-binding NarL/FixJ family response regulator